MYKLLSTLGYCIKDSNGRQFFACSIFDFVCLAIYTGISICNLWSASPSYGIWVLNLTIMGRIIVRNEIEMKELSRFYFETDSPPSYLFKNWHMIKLAVEITSAVLILLIFLVGLVCELRFGAPDKSFGIEFFIFGTAIIVLSACEDLLRIIEKMYSAGLPMQITEKNTWKVVQIWIMLW